MLLELIEDTVKLALIVAAVWLAIATYARRMQPAWSAHFARQRLAILLLLALVVVALAVAKDVLADRSGPLDEALLWAVHRHVPAGWTGFFHAITMGGSSKVLVPISAVAVVALAAFKRWREAWLLAASALAAPALVWALKSAIGRVRPALWETQWYWGSSFPSGHTLSTAAISTAAALCVRRIWPRFGPAALALALLWLVAVGMSRLVLGVHWPTDVLAAACVGLLIPLGIEVALGYLQPGEAAAPAAGDDQGGGSPAM